MTPTDAAKATWENMRRSSKRYAESKESFKNAYHKLALNARLTSRDIYEHYDMKRNLLSSYSELKNFKKVGPFLQIRFTRFAGSRPVLRGGWYPTDNPSEIVSWRGPQEVYCRALATTWFTLTMRGVREYQFNWGGNNALLTIPLEKGFFMFVLDDPTWTYGYCSGLYVFDNH